MILAQQLLHGRSRLVPGVALVLDALFPYLDLQFYSKFKLATCFNPIFDKLYLDLNLACRQFNQAVVV